MAYLEAPRSGTDIAAGTYVLGPGTLISAAVAVCLAQVALVPAARWHSVAAAAGAVSSGPL